MYTTEKCGNCEAVDYECLSENISFKYKDSSLSYRCEFALCPNCGDEVIFPEQSKVNYVRATEARRLHDEMLTPSLIKEVRKYFKITQSEAGELFGGGSQAFTKYENGKICQSKPLDILFRVLIANPINPRDFILKSDMNVDISMLNEDFEMLGFEPVLEKILTQSSSSKSDWLETVAAKPDTPIKTSNPPSPITSLFQHWPSANDQHHQDATVMELA